ncbi:hypothetical protein [Pendulispora albinea]|uniref:Uncharacterized protein n=1 Tax=Pendulispora albinea TaxID=2741071 RepID=A0ABZ2M5Z0_9BACT
MADPPLPKPAGPHPNVPSAEDLDRLAALIKPSWELDDSPFSMGNRSLTAEEWEQLRGEPERGALQNGSSKHASATVSASAAGAPGAIGVTASNGAAPKLEVVADSGPMPPVAPPPSSSPPVFPLTTPSFPAGPTKPTAGTLEGPSLAPDPFRNEVVEARPPVPVAAIPEPEPELVPARRRPTSLSDELAMPQKSRKGLFFGLIAAAAVVVGGIFFATRGSDGDAAPSASPEETSGKGASVSNARVDIPPTRETVAPTPPASTAPAPAPAPPAREAPAARAATKEPDNAGAGRNGAQNREHGSNSRAAPLPRLPATHNTPPPAAKPSSKGNTNSGGIVRDVPF